MSSLAEIATAPYAFTSSGLRCIYISSIIYFLIYKIGMYASKCMFCTSRHSLLRIAFRHASLLCKPSLVFDFDGGRVNRENAVEHHTSGIRLLIIFYCKIKMCFLKCFKIYITYFWLLYIKCCALCTSDLRIYFYTKTMTYSFTPNQRKSLLSVNIFLTASRQ